MILLTSYFINDRYLRVRQLVRRSMVAYYTQYMMVAPVPPTKYLRLRTIPSHSRFHRLKLAVLPSQMHMHVTVALLPQYMSDNISQ